MDIREDDLFSLSPAASAALAALFAGAVRPCLRVFLSFLSDDGPRLELAAAEPEAEDVSFTRDGWRIVVNRQLFQQAAPLAVDCGEQGFAIASSLDFSEAGGNCGGTCSH
ncbi:MAG TPA: hypothetical protein PKD41_03450 [Solidesulfovibrio sp.]|nr:hypothetical protein [Desulfovibrio sp.]HML59916.1 hypothetical protein [Solidesulfovibrio sp.]